MGNKKAPVIRFKGYTEDWEQRKLGDVSPLRGGYAFQSEKFRSQGVPIIRISNILSDIQICQSERVKSGIMEFNS